MDEKKVISLTEYKDTRLQRNKRKSNKSEDIERVKTLNLFMKVLETIHKQSYK
ncbi:hypothetical protein [Serpentinicella alkaliphila]|uniref:Uncharacterized protein n=1 Tax=Serpentinicella alkaliphila TaxID=1734049 RepID=A0A4R2TGE8_9FIRM|nr:hypothetical protein [Serpentinicella alkaliphila]QUH25129.1 hypothetical protein HZR23_04540 [Serpentinicella alkaliphila]TCQ01776.1 hypothetical protein EDD79_102352 [Serpentinicella alkaliphila]